MRELGYERLHIGGERVLCACIRRSERRGEAARDTRSEKRSMCLVSHARVLEHGLKNTLMSALANNTFRFFVSLLSWYVY